MSPLVALFFLPAFLFVWPCWLVFTLLFPDQWAWLFDREQGFLIKHGLVSKSFSRHLERMEKGIVLKVVLVATVLLGTMALTLIILRYILGLPVGMDCEERKIAS
jgi:hypothetical protein